MEARGAHSPGARCEAPPVGSAARQHRPHSSLTRTAEPSQTVETTRWLTATGWAQWNQLVKVLKRRWLLAAEARRGNIVGDVRNVVACRHPPKLIFYSLRRKVAATC